MLHDLRPQAGMTPTVGLLYATVYDTYLSHQAHMPG